MTLQLPDELRALLRAWIEQVLSERGWSARHWALQAGLSPTTLTRLLNNERSSLPTAEALARLCRAAGSQPSFLAAPAVGFFWVPVLSRKLLGAYVSGIVNVQQSAIEAARGTGVVVPCIYKPSAYAIAVQLTADTGAGRGLTKGSFVICEPDHMVPLQEGAIVAAITGEEIGSWIYKPPYLLPASATPAMPMPLDQAKIIGTVVAQHRTEF